MSVVCRTEKSHTTKRGPKAVRAIVVACTAFAASALSSLAAAPAHADPGICIDHVTENGHEATDAVLRACKIAKTGKRADVRECRRILDGEGVSADVAKHACRIASYPEETSS
ncbi:hypothetical protein ALI22I_17780 [Saccharothrix sp. ALI-22-I]|uniref:hypothetical protein n=1 Tax=Saccharothrix sp. ALI-22-I TaxID=1933778 RepID=UPI00097BE3F4|nr:hypothetical protein [Saccharothrix sp. ALI-22-I]ONI88822.1 hypothetical protein ALI22I_17780 [Saccharothrix sp. ALI-22-I]